MRFWCKASDAWRESRRSPGNKRSHVQHVDVSGPFSLPGTNLAVCPACGHTVSLYVCPGNKSNCNALTHGDMVSLDEGRFPTLELNNRRLSVKNSFCRKNGVYTRSVLGIPVLSALAGVEEVGGRYQIPGAESPRTRWRVTSTT